ncbi:MAG: type II secretion system F family protein [Bacteriovoracaceae bacterium]|jgi:tight adherence protein C|nr:type II secretion system F family protein [Bacteriovoracaceae bacterium]
MLLWASTIAMGIAVFMIANTMFTEEDQFKASESLDDDENQVKPEQGIILKYSKPFFKRYVSPYVGTMKSIKTIRGKYKKKLANAGLTQEMSADDFYSFKLFLILGFPIVFLLLREFLEETWPLSFAPVMGILGFYYPDIWIDGRIKQRKDDILVGFPFIVDLLALSIEAGLDFVAAISKVIDKAPAGPIVDEFEILLKELRIGSSREEALRSLAWRCDLIQVTSFSAALIAANSVGASVGPILKGQSQDLRQKRSTDAEKKGAEAATKILLPMFMFFLPAVVIIIMAPLAVQWMTGG